MLNPPKCLNFVLGLEAGIDSTGECLGSCSPATSGNGDEHEDGPWHSREKRCYGTV